MLAYIYILFSYRHTSNKMSGCFHRSKKLSVPASVVSRIMGRGGCNITAIQDVTGAHIDVDKQKDKNGERMITIRYI